MTKLETLVSEMASRGMKVDMHPRLVQEGTEVIIETLFVGKRVEEFGDKLADVATSMQDMATNDTEKWRAGFRGLVEPGLILVEFVVSGWGLAPGEQS